MYYILLHLALNFNSHTWQLFCSEHNWLLVFMIVGCLVTFRPSWCGSPLNFFLYDIENFWFSYFWKSKKQILNGHKFLNVELLTFSFCSRRGGRIISYIVASCAMLIMVILYVAVHHSHKLKQEKLLEKINWNFEVIPL